MVSIYFCIFIGFASYMSGALVAEFGRTHDAFVVGFQHLLIMLVFMVILFVLGWEHGKHGSS